MLLISVRNITKHFGPEPVLDGVTFDLYARQRIGLVGPNGTGKTTLLKILAGAEEMDGGTIERAGTVRLGYLEQHPTFPPGTTVWEQARGALAHLLRLSEDAEAVARQIARTADATARRQLERRFDELQHELHLADAYQLDHRIEQVLAGLGFAAEQYHQPVEQLSGGQQNRLELARLLLSDPDVMLLDEPSNHLDIEATEWLEGFLASSPRAMIVVSHDRYLLDKVTTRTLELYQGTVEDYAGNFSAYWRQKAERVEVQRRTYERQQAEIAKMEDFIRRNHYGQKHAQAEDRRKKLARIERVPPPREIAAPVMGFPRATRTGDVVLRVERLTKGYRQPLFENLSLDILRGERWGILGPNGCGKTTLLRCLLGEIEPDAGRVIRGAGVKIGYFDQHLACLAPETEVVEAIRPPGRIFQEQQRRDLLARFGLTGDIAFQKVRSLSGGERNRTALARLAALEANVLVLDEPTNHLDLWARDRLEHSLREFEGTVLFITHDRYFLNRVADHLLVAECGRWRVIEGDYDAYLHLVRQGLAGGDRAPADAAPSQPAAASALSAGGNGEPAPRRRRKFPYRKIAEIEADIIQCESQVESLHAALASPEVLRDGERVKAVKAELEQAQQQLARLYEHWEEAAELNW